MPIFRILLLVFLVHPSLAPVSLANPDSGNEIALIVNPSVTQTSVSKNGLRAIFRMRLRNWQDNSAVTVFVLEDTAPLHGKFCKEILNVFPNQMRRAWNRLVFSGSGQAPITVNSSKEMLERVRSTPGAIGYLRREDITDEVRILQIE